MPLSSYLLVAFPCLLMQGVQADHPTPEQIAWLKKNAIVFNTAEAGSGFEDLMPLKELIGEARIVALGEGTHGTREFFQMKHRLVEFLAGEMGFTIFSIEANMPEAYRVNEYVQTGKGDPAKLLGGMYFWTWNTQEVLDMIHWMRRFNESGKGRIEFTGFDMQFPDVAMRIVQDFVRKVEPEYAKTLEDTYQAVRGAKKTAGGAGFGVATGSFPVEAAAGKRIVFSGYIKTEGITNGYAGLWWRADGKTGVLAFDNMQSRKIKGTTPWTRYQFELDIPSETININFGVLHPGDGTAWFDALKVEIDGKEYVNKDLFDFDFESPSQRPKGFLTGGESYLIALDSGTAQSGKQSLRIERRKSDPKKVQGLDARAAARKCREVLGHLESSRGRYQKSESSEKIEWAIQNARVVLQCFQMYSNEVSRDQSMAQNVKWILDHAEPDTKIILWAHNGHVNKLMGAMGAHLDRMYGDQMVVLGFACHQGRYTAVGDKGLGSHDIQAPPPGSVESYFHSTHLPRFILDLRKASTEAPESQWLTQPIRFRSIGALAIEQQFHPYNVSMAFDALIYFEKTTASRLLGR